MLLAYLVLSWLFNSLGWAVLGPSTLTSDAADIVCLMFGGCLPHTMRAPEHKVVPRRAGWQIERRCCVEQRRCVPVVFELRSADGHFKSINEEMHL